MSTDESASSEPIRASKKSVLSRIGIYGAGVLRGGNSNPSIDTLSELKSSSTNGGAYALNRTNKGSKAKFSSYDSSPEQRDRLFSLTVENTDAAADSLKSHPPDTVRYYTIHFSQTVMVG